MALAGIYLKLTSSPPINGPANPTVAVAGGQPSGFGVDSSFESLAAVTGVGGSANLFGGAGASVGRSTPQELSVSLQGVPAVTSLYGAAAALSNVTRACVVSTASATGGIATDWVSHYLLLRGVVLTGFQIYESEGDTRAYVEVKLSYAALFHAWFATPAGGSLGPRTSAGYDWVNNVPWNGS